MNNAIAVVYCFIEKEGRYLLTREVGKPGYKFSGGKINDGESVVDAAKREVKEETGLDIELGNLVYIQEYLGGDHRIKFFYKAKWLNGEVVLQSEEIERIEWKTIKEIKQMTESDFFQKSVYFASRALVNNRKIEDECFEIVRK